MKKIVLSTLLCVLFLQSAAIVLAKDDAAAKDVFTIIHSRKSVRNFTGAAVSKADLETIVRAGMAAPTAANKQPWAFVIVTGRKQLDQLAAGLPHAKMLEKAGAAIIVCAIPQASINKSNDYAVIDASLASENILLAVEGLGLGAVWTAAYPDQDRIKAVRDALKIPSDIIPLNVIPIGYPTGVDQPKDKYKIEKIHWEKW
jgi:nitroreductase